MKQATVVTLARLPGGVSGISQGAVPAEGLLAWDRYKSMSEDYDEHAD